MRRLLLVVSAIALASSAGPVLAAKGQDIQAIKGAVLAAAEVDRSDCNNDSNDDCSPNSSPSVWYHPSGKTTWGSLLSGNIYGNTPGQYGDDQGGPGTDPSTGPGPFYGCDSGGPPTGCDGRASVGDGFGAAHGLPNYFGL